MSIAIQTLIKCLRVSSLVVRCYLQVAYNYTNPLNWLGCSLFMLLFSNFLTYHKAHIKIHSFYIWTFNLKLRLDVLIFSRLEPENVLRVFLSYMVYTQCRARWPTVGRFSFTESIEQSGSQRDTKSPNFAPKNAEKVHVYIEYYSFIKKINEQNKDVLNWLSGWVCSKNDLKIWINLNVQKSV